MPGVTIDVGRPRRYRTLGCVFNAPAAGWVAAYRRRFEGLGAHDPAQCRFTVRTGDIHECCGMLALAHLGYKVPVDLSDWLRRGLDVAVDYFRGDWWLGDEDSELAMDPSPGNEDFHWFNPFSGALLLALLSDRAEDLGPICDWPEAGFHDRADPLQSELPMPNVRDTRWLSGVYLSVAASFRGGPMPGLDDLEADLRKTSKVRPRLLFAAWEAARSGDQAGFGRAFARSVAHFAARPKPIRIPLDWVAPHHSVVALAAVRLGLAIPALPPKLDATIITRASLGLDPPRPGPAPPSGLSDRQIAAMVRRYAPAEQPYSSNPGALLSYVLGGLIRLEARSLRDGRPLDHASVLAWFEKQRGLRRLFQDKAELARCVEAAWNITQQPRQPGRGAVRPN